jgi:hypothetical protein
MNMHISRFVFCVGWLMVGVGVTVYILVSDYLFRKRYKITEPPAKTFWNGVLVLMLYFILCTIIWPVTLIFHWLFTPFIEQDMIDGHYMSDE